MGNSFRHVVADFHTRNTDLFTFTFTFMHLADAKSDLQDSVSIQDIIIIIFFISIRVSRELNPRPFALITQCSTTEPQEQAHFNTMHVIILIVQTVLSAVIAFLHLGIFKYLSGTI